MCDYIAVNVFFLNCLFHLINKFNAPEKRIIYIYILCGYKSDSHFSLCFIFSRKSQIKEWKRIIKSLCITFNEDYEFICNLGSEIKIQNWIISGLPVDKFSVENAVIIDNTSR